MRGRRIDGAQIGKHVGRTKGLTKNPLSCESERQRRFYDARGRVSRRRTNSPGEFFRPFFPSCLLPLDLSEGKARETGGRLGRKGGKEDLARRSERKLDDNRRGVLLASTSNLTCV